MTPRGSRPAEARIAFDALSIEGGLLGADWLGRVAQRRAPAQEPADYRIPKGLDVRDEIARSWRIAQACFRELEAGRAAGGDPRALAERFVEPLLRDAFGFASLAGAEPRTIGDRVYPVRFFALGDRVPVVVARAGAGLDTLLPELGDDQRRRSAFGLLQETLNASGAMLWGVATDGLTLRIARENASLTRPAWIEADLGRIFTEDLYPDFAALWLLAHESRFGRPDDPDVDVSAGGVARGGPGGGDSGAGEVERGLPGGAQDLWGRGSFPIPRTGSSALRCTRAISRRTATSSSFCDWSTGSSSCSRWKSATCCTRGTPPTRPAASMPKDMACAASAIAPSAAARTTGRAISGRPSGSSSAAFPAGSRVSACPRSPACSQPDECPALDAAKLENRALLGALFRLAWLREPSGLVRVNWRDMGADELGYVYEGLLELVPQITGDGRSFSFAGADESRGHARKTTGSFYTPDELVQVLLDSALDPVVERTVGAHPERPVDALLDLAIVDPACGSGHFLLAAARRLADRIARIRAGGTPAPDGYQSALRDVVRRCLYGVDRNPLAVELCKVSLWMESIDPGLPLTFLESHVRCGNSLVGTTRALMGDQVPEAAWAVLEGDDTRITRSLKQRNRAEIAGQRRLLPEPRDEAVNLSDAIRTVDQAPDADAAALASKQREWKALLASAAYEQEKLVADAWCAAFLWPKGAPGPVVEAAPTTATWLALRDGEGAPSPVLVETTRRIADDYGLFHWELAFPGCLRARRFRRRARQSAVGAGEAAGAGVLRHARARDRGGAERGRAEEADRGASRHGPGSLEGLGRRNTGRAGAEPLRAAVRALPAVREG